VFISLAFVWVLHPVGASVAILEVHNELLTITAVDDNWNETIRPYGDWSSAVLVSLAILSVVPFWYVQSLYRRDRVLAYLERKCNNNIGRRTIIDEEAFEDIQYLGENGRTGIEKKQVLEVITRLTKKIQSHPHYSGASLEQIALAIQATLRQCDTENFLKGITIIKNSIISLEEHNLTSAPDMGMALRTLRRLGELAIEQNSEIATLSVLDAAALGGQDSNGVFCLATKVLLELGTMALKARQYFVAVAVLNRLESMTLHGQPLTPERASDYLGLIAHFWNAGIALKDRAIASVENTDFQPSLEACIATSKKTHVRQADFETADYLTMMLYDIERRQSGRTSLARFFKQLRSLVRSCSYLI
jgi:hypothetical protein